MTPKEKEIKDWWRSLSWNQQQCFLCLVTPTKIIFRNQEDTATLPDLIQPSK